MQSFTQEIPEAVKKFIKSDHGQKILLAASMYGQNVINISKEKYSVKWLISLVNGGNY